MTESRCAIRRDSVFVRVRGGATFPESCRLTDRLHEIWIIDISLLPEFRGRGIGGRIMHELLQEAESVRLPLRIHVGQYDPARRRQVDDTGVHFLMEWTPSAASGL